MSKEMSLIQIFIQILYLKHAFCFNLSPGTPLPHADELDRILSKTVFTNTTGLSGSSVFQYLFGDYDNITDLEESENTENLDISILDPDTLTKILQAAREQELAWTPSRRYEGYYFNDALSNRSLEFMRQSIYDTRRRLIVTRPIRKKYHQDISYNIGIVYGALMQLRIKIDNVYSAMRKLEIWHALLWHIFLYQRTVALNVDIEYSVQRMFQFHKKWKDLFRPQEEQDEESRGQPPENPYNKQVDAENDEN